MQNYQSLDETGHHDPAESSSHLHFQADTRSSKWNHIIDLDSFFTRLYHYHQNHGFSSMMMQESFLINQYFCLGILIIYLVHGVRYDILFTKSVTKVHLDEVFLTPGECIANFTVLSWFLVIVSFTVLSLKALRAIYSMFLFWDIKQFYNVALEIPDTQLGNTTWHEVQTRVRHAQMEHQMCIHKVNLTELDIYHRILRQKNYFVALVNKRLLPPRINIPFLGEHVFWTRTLHYNMQWLFFWSPWSPFENLFSLRDEYRKQSLRHELAAQFRKHTLYLAAINLILSPLILFWQFLYTFFNYAELFRRDPRKIGLRGWSLYGQLYLRHFNELEHELQARLKRAYKPATRYLSIFTSHKLTLITQHLRFLAGCIMVVIFALTVYDEDVMNVEYIFTIFSILGLLVALSLAIEPEENNPWNAESLLSTVVMQIHYFPNDWKGRAHTSKIREQFQQLFQYRIVGLLEDVFSPIITPFVLWKCVAPRSLDIVDFFRNFTVNVVGVGDVCSFAEMDIKRHGNPDWISNSLTKAVHTDQYNQAEDGKIELSLIHFKGTNPNWTVPPTANEFVHEVQQHSLEENLRSLIRAPSEESQQRAQLQPQRDHPIAGDYDMQPFNMYNAEGPDQYTSVKLETSVMYLHDRQSLNSKKRTRDDGTEETPLLLGPFYNS